MNELYGIMILCLVEERKELERRLEKREEYENFNEIISRILEIDSILSEFEKVMHLKLKERRVM